MTPDVAAVYNNMIDAGIDGDVVFLQLTRMVPVEVLEMAEEETSEETPDEQVEDIGEDPELLETVAREEDTPVESISHD
jgi:hypothetical protein